MARVSKSEAEWRAELTPEQYRVLREKGTERPFTGEYDHTFEPGSYRCAGCGAELFTSETKYDSGCGWPAFYAPASDEAIDEEVDTSYGMVRTEVMCANCGGHLGHLFPDGPHPTGIRYCINSASLRARGGVTARARPQRAGGPRPAEPPQPPVQFFVTQASMFWRAWVNCGPLNSLPSFAIFASVAASGTFPLLRSTPLRSPAIFE